MKKPIEKIDKLGNSKVEINYPNDDLYIYIRFSGAYFMLFSFLTGILFGVLSSAFVYNYFIK